MARVLCIGDLHLPAIHPDYLQFVKDLKRKYKTNTTVFIGDVLDHHSISFHQKNPELPSAIDEHEQAIKGMKAWKKAFPEAMVCIGNHDERVHRLSATAGIPSMYLVDYVELYDTPNWEWDYSFLIDDVMYTHGTGAGGQRPAYSAAIKLGHSVVMGHVHSNAMLQILQSPTQRIFGLNVGCGVNTHHRAMNYAKNHLSKPVLGAGVIIDGKPSLKLM